MPSSICGTDAMRIPDARISYAAVAVRQHNKSLKAPIARRKLVLRKRESGLKTEVKVARTAPSNVAIERIVNHFGVLTTGELVNEIMTHLRQDAPALSRMMCVNNQFAAAATHLLWGSAYPEDLSRARDKGYAKFVTKAHFWTHESLSSSESAVQPIFSAKKQQNIGQPTIVLLRMAAVNPEENVKTGGDESNEDDEEASVSSA